MPSRNLGTSPNIIKIFSLPTATPFDKSERSFMVVDRIADTNEGRIRRFTKRAEAGSSATRSIRNNRSNLGKVSTGKLRTDIPVQRKQKASAETRLLSAYPTGTYYVYAYDGRLLAEYNDVGLCTRDYIYVGNKLIAEYRPVENKYYYYTSDQINSTRIVTDDFGTVVYASAHDPYGGEQHTWINTYNPSLKFSGKEHDEESGLDYFGARYYDRTQYRFISVDPIIISEMSVSNPQSWNLYSYCGNNPLIYIDSTGLYKKAVHYDLTYYLALQAGFTRAEAHLIASADNAVDTSASTDSLRANFLHFPNSAMLAYARIGAMNASNLVELGFCLHMIQDSYAHDGYSIPVKIPLPGGGYIKIEFPVNNVTHLMLSVMSSAGFCYDPDDPAANQSNYEKMCKETYYALVFWLANRIRFHNDVIFQNPCQ